MSTAAEGCALASHQPLKAASPLTWLVRRQGVNVVAGECLVETDEVLGGEEWPPARLVSQLATSRSQVLNHWAFGGLTSENCEDLVQLSFGARLGQYHLSVQASAGSGSSCVVTLAPVLFAAEAAVSPAFCFDIVLSGAGQCMFCLEPDTHRVRYASSRFESVFGVALEACRNGYVPWCAKIAPEEQPDPAELKALLRQHGMLRRHYRINPEPGQPPRWIKVHMSWQSCVSGGFITCLAYDATETQMLENEVAALRQAVDYSKEGFALTDAAGNYVYVNDEQARVFGYGSGANLLGENWRVLCTEAGAAEIEKKIFPQLLEYGFWHGATEGRRRDGTLFWQDLTLSLLPNGGLVSNCRDRTAEITLRRRMENSEAMFRGFLDALPMGVSIRSASGGEEFVNRYAAKEKALPLAQLCQDAGPTAAGDKRESTLEVADGGASRIFELLRFPLLTADGEVGRNCAVAFEITRLKQLEKEAQSVAEKRGQYLAMQREFISMVSHEFRTPLTAIQGTHYLLAEALGAGAEGRLQRYLNLQKRSLETLKELVDQVLLLNRVEHTSATDKTAPEAPQRIVEAAIEAATVAPETKRVHLRSTLPEAYRAVVDEGLFRAAFENLLSNALKYSPPPSPVSVDLAPAEDGFVLRVTDTGRGIPAEEQAELFRPFFRASNVGIVPGTGLGLAIVKRAVACHGGRIDFHSDVGRGTSFELFFPQEPSQSENP